MCRRGDAPTMSPLTVVIALEEDAMVACSKCGARNELNQTICVVCGTRVRDESVDSEVGHIDYVLTEIPRWEQWGWIYPAMAERLSRHYRSRQESLRNPTTPITPPLPADVSLQWRSAQPARQVESADSTPPRSTRVETGPPWIAEFLEAHWLKLLATLAATFIFVGMRQVLGWEWVSAFAIAMLPLLPIGLAGTLYYFGLKARAAETIGGFAYLAVSIVLSGFSVFSVNHYWLGGAIPQPVCLTLATATATVLSAITLQITREDGFVQLLLAGILATLNAFLRMILPIPLDNAAVGPIYFAANFAFGVSLFMVARALNESEDRNRIVLTWAHLSVTAAFLWMCLPAAMRGAVPENAAVFLFASGGLYLLTAQAFTSAGMGYVSSAFAAAGAGLLLHDLHRIELYPCGFAALALAGSALALSFINRGHEKDDPRNALSCAYEGLAVLYTSAAGITVGLRALLSMSGEQPALTAGDWPAGVLLAMLCSAAFAVMTAYKRRPEYVLPTSILALIGMTLATDRLLTLTGLVPTPTLALSLLPFVAVSAGIVVALLARQQADSNDAVEPYARILLATLAAASVAALGVIFQTGIERVPDPAWWAALAGYAMVFSLLARGIPESSCRSWRSVAASAAVGCLGAAGGFLGRALFPNAEVIAAGLCLSVMGWALLGLGELTKNCDDGLWLNPFRGSGMAAGFLGGLLAASAPHASPVVIALTSGISFALFVSVLSWPPEGLPMFASGIIGGLGAIRLAAFSPEVGLLFAAAVGCAYAFQAHRLSRMEIAWLGAGALAFAAGLGTVTPGSGIILTGILASASLLAGAVWTIYSAQRWESASFGYAAGPMVLAACVRALAIISPLNSEWLPLQVLPVLTALYLAGRLTREKADEFIGIPFREFAVPASVVACVTTALWTLAGGGNITVTAATLGAYGGLYLIRAIADPSEKWVALAGVTLCTAAGFGIAELTTSPGRWSAGFAMVSLAVLVVAVMCRRRQEAFQPLTQLAAAAASISAVTALLVASQPGEGLYSILALMESGAVFASLAILKLGEIYAHGAFACWFLAYGLALYDKVGLDSGNLDYFMIPFALYLLALSHFATRREAADSAAHLWWMGLLALFTPTYIAFYTHYVEGGSPVHALLLVVECVGAVAWGIAHRIKAFVLSGTAFSLAFAATLGSGVVVEIWTGLIAVSVGVVLLAFVFYVSLHQEAIRNWLQRFNREWSRWR